MNDLSGGGRSDAAGQVRKNLGRAERPVDPLEEEPPL